MASILDLGLAPLDGVHGVPDELIDWLLRQEWQTSDGAASGGGFF
jgi:hypothetical protein